MGIFRSDPQPVQLTPHVPAAALTTGSQPPRNAVAGALAIACVLASWPAQGEPHPIQPMQGRSQIAPLTLTYGQQPPRIDLMPRVQYRTAIVSWPEDKEPRLQFNNQQPERRYVVPLALVYGNLPPVTGPASPTSANVAARSWDPPRPEPPPLVKVAPLTLGYGDAPPNIPPLSATAVQTFRFAWEPPRPEPPPLVKIVPLTLVYGQTPPLVGPLTETELNIALAPSLWWSAQTVRPTAAWNIPPIVAGIPFAPLPGGIIASWQTDWRAQAAGRIAPLTLAYGQQPPVQGTLTVPSLSAILAPRDSWTAQSESDNAHWNVPPIAAFLPFARLPQSVLAAWLPPDSGAQSRGPIAPLSLLYGQQPPLVGSITPAELNEIVRAWDLNWSAQSQFANAGWNIPLVIVPPLPFTLQRHMVRHAWEPPFQFPQTLMGTAGWNFIAILTRAIALSDGASAIVGDSKTIAIILNDGSIAVLGNSATAAPDSPQNSTDSIKSGD